MRRKKYLSKFDWYSILSPAFLFVGQGLDFWYRTSNRFGVPPEYAHRAISITQIEYLRGVGIAAEWIKRDPLIRRGSWLVTGIDIDLCEERSFYWEAMHQRRVRDAGVTKCGVEYSPPHPRPVPLPALRLGYAAPGEFIDWVSEPFRPTRRDRVQLGEKVRGLEESDFELFSGLQLSAFPVRVA